MDKQDSDNAKTAGAKTAGAKTAGSDLSVFDLDEFITCLRKAVTAPSPAKAIRAEMDRYFENPEAVRQAMPTFDTDEETLFEDETVSIFYCRFRPNYTIPPHDHQTSAVIGIYEGQERNNFFTTAGDAFITKGKSVDMQAGDVLSIGPNAIHTVECTGSTPSYGIHVYLAPLSRIERNLYDVAAQMVIPFTDADFQRLVSDDEATVSSQA